ncbi:M28 family metallopeptidase [Vitiosangium sp. GDMCC 1.1324]|uniref:M28 family metallopeptidase n=1 Tax=Vitiosangium sp. (strain GDMCC 1.1324) TaxID=2138576 RepID=UPI000D339CCC|nr:M28 family peptidase [Vitiosangium sp. GDMCC 1.1324]PTL75149.1 hypothetical protein DAT35_56390 [Vitiosangium sp. GDMCC 1.1324]
MSLSIRSSLVMLAAGLGLAGGASCTPTQVLEGADVPRLKAISEEVDTERVWDNLKELTEQHMSDQSLPCESLFPANIRKAYPELCNLSNTKSGKWVRDRFAHLELSSQDDVSTGDTDVSTTNIVAEIKGTSKPDEVILVGAHYDAFWQGADDNSSGVAAMMELARVLSKYKFERTIRFVGFDLEEWGISGSHRYVKAGNGEKVVTALVFDCIGYYSEEEGSQKSLPGLPSPTKADFLAIIGNDESAYEASQVYALNNELKLMNTVPLISSGNGTPTMGQALTLSDHLAFWFAHHKAVFLTDTAPFRNPNYHKKTDTLDTLDKARLGQATRVAATAIAYWAGGPTP